MAELKSPRTRGQQPGHGIDHHEGRRLPAGEHVVADRQLAVDEALAQALVHPLVVAAEQHQVLLQGQLRRQLLVEGSPSAVR